MGDPAGIGPEIVQKALRLRPPSCPALVLAPAGLFSPSDYHSLPEPAAIPSRGVHLLEVETKSGCEASYEVARRAADLALSGKVQAIVTGPISKKKWALAGIPHAGHTDFLAHHAGISRYAMCFWSMGLRVVLFTTHLPLREVFHHIHTREIVSFVDLVDGELTRLFGRSFTFLFCGLNPHSGEGGSLGREEEDEILPAIQELRSRVHVAGIFPPDVAFLKSRDFPDSVVVSWYHDQGLIPFKLLHFRKGVNLTLGLPYVRTSPDHGTAFDIAGRGAADPSSMLAAIRLAESLAKGASTR